MIPDVTLAIEGTGTLVGGVQAPSSFVDNIPDTMKLDAGTLIFVVLLVTCLFFFMKYVCFRPIVRVVDEREATIKCGALKLAEAVALVERRQADYAASLRELRIRALEHRKALSVATARTKQDLLDRARQDSQRQLEAAILELDALKATAKDELLTHVDALSDSLIQNLIRQA